MKQKDIAQAMTMRKQYLILNLLDSPEYYSSIPSWTKCLKNQPCDVKKIREMRGEVGKKTLKKKRWIITHFYDVTWLIFETLCPVTLINRVRLIFYLV